MTVAKYMSPVEKIDAVRTPEAVPLPPTQPQPFGVTLSVSPQ